MYNVQFEVFESNEQTCNANKNDDKSISNCCGVTRIVNALKYHSVLLSEKDSNDGRNKFIEFCNDVYGANLFVNDYIHLISNHSEQIMKINAECGKCDMSQCRLTQRHFRPRGKEETKDDVEFEPNYYCDAFENLHFYIMHLEDTGLRIFKTVGTNKAEEHKESKHLNCVDDAFTAKYNEILSKKRKYDFQFDRLDNTQNNKFNIKVAQKKQDKRNNNTFIDHMLHKLNENIKDDSVTVELSNYLFSEDYDTDSIMNEIEENDEYLLCNLAISGTNNNAECMEVVHSFIKKYNISSCSFSTGIIFFYHEWYNDINNQQIFRNAQYDNDFGGESVINLLARKYYPCLKAEALASGFVNVADFGKLVINKARIYINSNKCREMQCVFRTDPLHFGIKQSAPLNICHLESLILYTDFTKFSTSFSSTFRAIEWDESTKSMKARHEKYYHIARYLNEVIVYYGLNGNKNEDKYEHGPFYCGMSSVLNIGAFSIRLNGPTSTSKQMEIAINFAKRDGIIIQLNNRSGFSRYERFLDVCWLSNFAEEDERIMIRGRYKLEIQSLRIYEQTKWNNYEIFMRSFYLFDCLVSGDWPLDDNYKPIMVQSNHISIIDKSINNYFDVATNNFAKYINDIFYLFLQQKSQIILHIGHMDKQIKDQTFIGYIMTSVKEQDFVDKDTYNLFKPDLFKLFPNITEIIIYTTWSHHIYAFSISKLINICESSRATSLNRVIIKDRQKQWLFKAAQAMCRSNCIQLKRNNHEDCLTISM